MRRPATRPAGNGERHARLGTRSKSFCHHRPARTRYHLAVKFHVLTIFFRNPTGHYKAINLNFSNYYLSEEFVLFFTQQHTWHPT
jgi:hypothetical protein